MTFETKTDNLCIKCQRNIHIGQTVSCIAYPDFVVCAECMKKEVIDKVRVKEAIDSDIKAITEVIMQSEDVYQAIGMLQDFRTALRKRKKDLGME